MYGMVNRAIEDMVTASHGAQAWERILEDSKVEVDAFISNEGYPDAITYGLVGAASKVLKLEPHQVLEAFGEYWILETTERGYSDLMASGGTTLEEFLLNLPNFHTRLSLMFPHLRPPEFRTQKSGEHSVLLQYYSERPGLTPFVKGLIQGLGKRFHTEARVQLLKKKGDGLDHDEFSVEW